MIGGLFKFKSAGPVLATTSGPEFVVDLREVLAATPGAVEVKEATFEHGTFLQALNEFGICLHGVRISGKGVDR